MGRKDFHRRGAESAEKRKAKTFTTEDTEGTEKEEQSGAASEFQHHTRAMGPGSG